MKKLTTILAFVIVVVLFNLQSCTKQDGLISIDNNMELLPRISDYHIFQGKAADLNPAPGFTQYEISTQLFTDYAEKQRLISLPAGYQMTAIDDGLPELPDGTILVKTFYYYNNKQDTSSGKNIIETRLLIKHDSQWNVGTYLWNSEQTEALLINTGMDKTVNWIDASGNAKTILYHVPNKKECNTCHQSENKLIAIGPKVRNMNMDVLRNGVSINQLVYFSKTNLMKPVDPSLFTQLPDWKNVTHKLEERARAYLDINCAHCHNRNGFAAKTNLFFGYETPLNATRIAIKKESIATNLSKGKMPKLGITIIDEEGVGLIKQYLATLP
ncbi:MAG: hypothetical protein V4557_19445 [Bacteroidota bacterium]